jgi:hypothetical protein
VKVHIVGGNGNSSSPGREKREKKNRNRIFAGKEKQILDSVVEE